MLPGRKPSSMGTKSDVRRNRLCSLLFADFVLGTPLMPKIRSNEYYERVVRGGGQLTRQCHADADGHLCFGISLFITKVKDAATGSP